MSRLFFIHGYSVDLETWFRKPLPFHAGFQLFDDEIINGNGTVFRWTPHRHFSILENLWPYAYIQHYLQERLLASSDTTRLNLGKELKRAKPEVIVCHSMGCHILLEYVKRKKLPPSVKKVVFLQGDCAVDELLDSSLLKLNVEVITTFRILDYSLWLSSLWHGRKRIGIQKISHPKIKCIYFSSFSSPNLHIAVMHDKKLKKLVGF